MPIFAQTLALIHSMCGIFKKKQKPFSQLSISEAIDESKKSGAIDLNLSLFYGKFILFQVGAAHHFKERGLEFNNHDDMTFIHFFHKKKIEWLEKGVWEKFKNSDYIEYEDPKGVFTYLKLVGNNSKEIELQIQKEIELYEVDSSIIQIEYNGA